MVLESSFLTLGLEGFDSGAVVPADSGGEVAEVGRFPEAVKHDGSEGVGDDDLLHVRVRMRAAFENFESGHSGGTSGGFVGDHSSDALPRDLGR